MKKWLNKLFGKEDRTPPFNMNHPDLVSNVEFAFEVGGRKFYRFVKDFQIPSGRYKFAEAYLYESELRMNLKTLNAYCDALIKELDGTSGQIKISTLLKIVWAIQSRCKLAFSPETIERLASAVYFDETEDLSDLDDDYCKKKVEFWRKHKSLAFFLTKPIIDLLNLNGFSEESLPTYILQIQQAEDIIKSLTLDPEKPSSPNSSEIKNIN